MLERPTTVGGGTRPLDPPPPRPLYTPSGASGALRSLGLQLLESLTTEVSSEESHSVAC